MAICSVYIYKNTTYSCWYCHTTIKIQKIEAIKTLFQIHIHETSYKSIIASEKYEIMGLFPLSKLNTLFKKKRKKYIKNDYYISLVWCAWYFGIAICQELSVLNFTWRSVSLLFYFLLKQTNCSQSFSGNARSSQSVS